MGWLRDITISKLSRGCTGLVLVMTRGHFSTKWLISYTATETHHTPQLKNPCSALFIKGAQNTPLSSETQFAKTCRKAAGSVKII